MADGVRRGDGGGPAAPHHLRPDPRAGPAPPTPNARGHVPVTTSWPSRRGGGLESYIGFISVEEQTVSEVIELQ